MTRPVLERGSMQNQSRDKRQHPRIPFKQAVKFQIGEYSCLDGSLSKDLSRGGVCLTVNQFVPVNSSVILYLQQNQQAKLVIVKGKVAWVKMLPDSDQCQIGVQFQGLDESVRMEVNNIIVALG